MLDLYEEMLQVVRKLEQERIDYALCGGLAMAVYDVIRATVDIDLLILTLDVDRCECKNCCCTRQRSKVRRQRSAKTKIYIFSFYRKRA